MRRSNGKRKREGGNGFALLFKLALLFVILALSLFTLGVIAIKVGDFLPENVDMVFITSKSPSFKMGSGEKKWEKNTEISLFRSEYVNGENIITVASTDGEAVFAPGTQTSYEFCAYNDGNMAIEYEINASFFLEIAGVKADESRFPLRFRLQTYEGEYLLGGENEWVNITPEQGARYKGVLGAQCYQAFLLELAWEFEGNDELDTALGLASANESVLLSFTVETNATTHLDPKAQGGVQVNGELPEGFEYGGQLRWEYMCLLIAAIVALVFYAVVSF